MKRKTKFKRIHELEDVLAARENERVSKSVADLTAVIASPEESADCVNLARYIHNAKRKDEKK